MRAELSDKGARVYPLRAAARRRQPLSSKDYLSVLDLTPEDLTRVLDTAADLQGRARERPGVRETARRQARRPALRKAVAPDALHLRHCRPRAGRRAHRT